MDMGLLILGIVIFLIILIISILLLKVKIYLDLYFKDLEFNFYLIVKVLNISIYKKHYSLDKNQIMEKLKNKINSSKNDEMDSSESDELDKSSSSVSGGLKESNSSSNESYSSDSSVASDLDNSDNFDSSDSNISNDGLISKISEFKEIFIYFKKSFGSIKLFIKSLIKNINISKLDFNLDLGLPSYTKTIEVVSFIWAIKSLFYIYFDDININANPIFGKSKIDFECKLLIDFRIINLLIPGIKLISNKNVRLLIKELRDLNNS